jgi:TetR/AcrR family transcriptional regulator, fatty acid metabolism regulator protein
VVDLDNTQTSRSRLLAAARMLFSRNGYEQTSTAAIAREAGTSESQLVRYFSGKSGLLEAVFNEVWSSITGDISAAIGESSHGRDAIVRIFALFVDVFTRDHDAAFLFLFEGRRVRGHDVVLSQGFVKFLDLACKLIERGQADGSFRKDVPATLLAAAMVGTAEGMIRDRMIAERIGRPEPFTNEMIRTVFESMASGLAPSSTPSSA